jgi:hypothetical protein
MTVITGTRQPRRDREPQNPWRADQHPRRARRALPVPAATGGTAGPHAIKIHMRTLTPGDRWTDEVADPFWALRDELVRA